MLTIKYLATGLLIPYANNSRTHTEQQVKQVAASIQEFGFTNPILVDEDNGIIAGHARVLAAMLIGLEKVPTIMLEGLSGAQKKAYVIADNKLALNAGWDFDILQKEMAVLTDIDFDVSIIGFDVSELNFDAMDYSALDGEDLSGELEAMAEGVRKAIQIDFDDKDYQEAQELVKFWRSEDAYVGGMLIGLLRKEKSSL